MKLLITGVPATGKTTVGNHLSINNGFYHVDMEANDWENKRQLLCNPRDFFEQIDSFSNVVISWGFQPFEDVEAIQSLVMHGYKLIWFDGDREKAARVFVNRDYHDPIAEERFWAQVGAIEESDVVDSLKPKMVNVFNSNGFKNTALVSFALRHPLPNFPSERLKGLLEQHLALPTNLQR